ncbi:Transcription factor GATA-4 [Turnera subulata]|uniref:Transcription factor GATA-4 n=1 Tax=Turnera subulata TaxID=218843 RepID=A0A9Q0FA05_9ROSI|nr:Transcription factor GATA-4 [Turnera subulata]
MDVYGTTTTTPATDYFRIDDLLDLSNDEDLLSASSSSGNHHHLPPPPSSSVYHFPSSGSYIDPSLSSDFTDHLSVPSDDVAELEWLSQFVEDSFSDFPPNSSLTGYAILIIKPCMQAPTGINTSY